METYQLWRSSMSGTSFFYQRRPFILVVIALFATLAVCVPSFNHIAAADARPLPLTRQGDPRLLPDHLFGGSVESLIEHLLDDPAKVAALKQTAPAVIRFPGGSQANYYNWQTGLLTFPVQPNSSSY